MKRKSRASTGTGWAALISYAEHKLARSKVKTAQIEAILAQLREQERAGGVCPTDLAALGDGLSKRLQ